MSSAPTNVVAPPRRPSRCRIPTAIKRVAEEVEDVDRRRHRRLAVQVHLVEGRDRVRGHLEGEADREELPREAPGLDLPRGGVDGDDRGGADRDVEDVPRVRRQQVVDAERGGAEREVERRLSRERRAEEAARGPREDCCHGGHVASVEGRPPGGGALHERRRFARHDPPLAHRRLPQFPSGLLQRRGEGLRPPPAVNRTIVLRYLTVKLFGLACTDRADELFPAALVGVVPPCDVLAPIW